METELSGKKVELSLRDKASLLFGDLIDRATGKYDEGAQKVLEKERSTELKSNFTASYDAGRIGDQEPHYGEPLPTPSPEELEAIRQQLMDRLPELKSNFTASHDGWSLFESSPQDREEFKYAIQDVVAAPTRPKNH